MNGLTSVILPTYNRARFLPDAIGSIVSQTNGNWELIIVDDGSTDNTATLLPELCRKFAERVKIVRQENQGAYPARNAGLRLARGEYVAFFDSDDLWLPEHLEACVTALNTHRDVDWVYDACRMVNTLTDVEIAPSTFYENGRARPFMRLRADQRGDLHVITDPEIVRCAIVKGLYCGLQNSVIRRRIFESRLFAVDFHNEAEDQLFAIRAALAGYRFGYLDAVQVIYRVHDANSSASGLNMDIQQRLTISLELARGYEELLASDLVNGADRRAVRKRLNREYFWHAGYALLWQHGRRREALEMFARGLQRWPWSAACWKTYLLARARIRLGTALRS
jgi:glycosyltransferase involved in cell wall biosynthesis